MSLPQLNAQSLEGLLIAVMNLRDFQGRRLSLDPAEILHPEVVAQLPFDTRELIRQLLERRANNPITITLEDQLFGLKHKPL